MGRLVTYLARSRLIKMKCFPYFNFQLHYLKSIISETTVVPFKVLMISLLIMCTGSYNTSLQHLKPFSFSG